MESREFSRLLWETVAVFDTHHSKSLGLPGPPSSQFWSSEMFHDSTSCSKPFNSSSLFHTNTLFPTALRPSVNAWLTRSPSTGRNRSGKEKAQNRSLFETERYSNKNTLLERNTRNFRN